MKAFRATQDRNLLHLEGEYETAYPGYAYEITSVTINDDGSVDVMLDIFDTAEPGTIRLCVLGTVEINEAIDLSKVSGFNGQQLNAVTFLAPDSYTPEVDVDIDQA
tara:strand:+ start:65903 stop:66220 length:318 start_codon:yes stop_codon:yes gene_type:complete